MKKRIIIVLGILIAAGGIGTGVWYHFKGNGQSGTGDSIVYVSKVSVITGSETTAVNRFAGVVEPQKTVNVKIESGRKVKEVEVKTGEEVKAGQLLFEYDLSSIEDDLKQAQLDLDRLKNEQISLTEQIATLEAEKKKAKAEDQLSYTIEIETNKMNLKKNEYSQKSKQSEIDKLQSATQNTEVRSEIDGVIQKIDTSKMTSDDGDSVDDSSAMDSSMSSGDGSSDSSAFITILSTGAYRVKGKVNEQNRDSIVPGEAVIIRSRVDSSKTWKGTMGSVDVNNGTSDDSSNDMYMGMASTSSDDQTTSTSYPFYVELDSSENLMLGQHVYIERDIGQDEKKDGLWLSDYYILDTDTNEPYVWAASDKNRLEKRYVTLGEHDDDLGEYKIVEGLTKKDAIAFPTAALEEGEKTETGDLAQTMSGGADGITDMDADHGNMDDEQPDSADGEAYTDPDMEEGEYVAIMGPSGSGKTTLMNIIGCLDKQTEGTFFLDGVDIKACSENEMSDLRLNKIGFVFQSFHLLPKQSALANVEMPLNYARVPKKERRERALKALDRVGLADRVDFKPNQLSGGQMQRVAIARAIVNNPKLLLADEPTGALDSKSGAQVMELFQRLNDEGVSVLMITHDADIAAHAKRVVTIKDGILQEKR